MAEAWRPLQSSHGGSGHPPTLPPSSTVQFPTIIMKHDIISRNDTIAISRQTQPKVQHIVTIFTDNTSRVIWATVKNLITLDVNGLYS